MSERIPHWLEKQSEVNPHHIALESPDGGKKTFGELRQESRQMAQALMKSGVQKGDHIAFLSDNDLNYPVFIHAISYIGAVVVLLNTRLTSAEISYQLKDAHVKRLFISNSYEVKAEKASKNLNTAVQKVSELPQELADEYDLKRELALDEVYTMMYTSGTTGKPKAVMHTYGNHWFSAIASSLNLGLRHDDKWLMCLPLFHVGGFSVLMKSVIYGMTIHLMEKFEPSLVNKALITEGVSHVSVVTVMLQKLLEDLDGKRYPDHLKCMLLGGGPVPVHLLEQTADRNVPVFQTYGMTETSSQIATLSPESAFTKIGSAGKALSIAELWIDNDDEKQPGEIIVRGPMVSKGYYNHPHQRDAYLRTGDIGYKDEDGFLYVVDRVKDVIISGGENVYPAEIESVLSDIPGIREAGVTGRKDERWGEVPVAFLVSESPGTLEAEEVLDFCKERLGKYKLPAQLHWVEELPRNASNKVLRRQLFSLLDQED
ncbi:o-succinylbenzoate--CoA ligase [Halobacillus litoralis]|uniref:2-succinylbenzoate--CoA ligase n=1 Tax=Halobacillus litoralis TaxID=45668 RepID=A0A410MGR4_9BACI|nr:o-succinylbenzoate--CoA ligase [Halobacillus litoralis]QAS53878.1 o-succinylbenzoate--CoA ligase [Halobacillus litoralis]